MAGSERNHPGQPGFVPRAQTMLFYGGFDREPSNEFWRLDAGGWTRIADTERR